MAVTTVENGVLTGFERAPTRPVDANDSPDREGIRRIREAGTLSEERSEKRSPRRQAPDTNRANALLKNRELKLASLRRSLTQSLRRSFRRVPEQGGQQETSENNSTRLRNGDENETIRIDPEQTGTTRGPGEEENRSERPATREFGNRTNVERLQTRNRETGRAANPDQNRGVSPNQVLTRLRTIDQKINQLQFQQHQQTSEAIVNTLRSAFGQNEPDIQLAEQIERMSEQVRLQVQAEQVSDFIDLRQASSIGNLVDRRE